MIRKAVIPAAGLGTRMLPAARAIPKELLPVLDRPTIQYIVQEAADAGVGEAIVVTSRDKPALMEHFRQDAALDERLRAGGRDGLLASIRELVARVRVGAVFQEEQRGLGHAVLQARQAVGDESFVCLLGDTIFSGDSPSKQLVEAHERFGGSVIGLEEVPVEKLGRYGIVGGKVIEDGVIRVDRVIEKPRAEEAPSRFAIAARYVLTPGIFACLEQVKPAKLGEIQLSDAIEMLAKREPVHGVVLRGKRHDIGNPVDWLATNIVFASRDAELWHRIEPVIRAVMK